MMCRFSLILTSLALLFGAGTVGWTADARPDARLIDMTWSREGDQWVFTIVFDRPVALRFHENLLEKRYMYMDAYGVTDPAETGQWDLSDAPVFHIKRLAYASQKVLRFVFYVRRDVRYDIPFRGRRVTRHQLRVEPIVYQDPEAASGSVEGARKLVVIDPGHGCAPDDTVKSVGARTSRPIHGRHIYEKALVLQIARRLQEQLRTVPNLNCVLTRNTDTYVSLPDRIEVANRVGGDLFVSIHLNAQSKSRKTARGFEIFFLSDGSKETDRQLVALENDYGLGTGQDMQDLDGLRRILRSLANDRLAEQQVNSRRACMAIGAEFKYFGPFRQHYRGIKSAPFRVLMNYNMPSVLVECGFLDTPAEAAALVQPVVQQRIATLLFNGINRYFAIQDARFIPHRSPVRMP